jgi:hypothetical protein
MTIEIESHMRASEKVIEEILRTPTPTPAATATLVDLLSALDARRRCREKLQDSRHKPPD